MPNKTEWKKLIREQLFDKYAQLGDRGGQSDADRLTERIRGLPPQSEDRRAVFAAALELCAGKLSMVRVRALSVYVFESFGPIPSAMLDNAYELLIKQELPVLPSARCCLLRAFVSCGLTVDWEPFVHSKNWTHMFASDVLLALDVLVVAKQYDLFIKHATRAGEAGALRRASLREMLNRWKLSGVPRKKLRTLEVYL